MGKKVYHKTKRIVETPLKWQQLKNQQLSCNNQSFYGIDMNFLYINLKIFIRNFKMLILN